MARERPLYRQIYRDMVEAIQAGELRPGDRFPSERQLAEQFSVSRITSKKALEQLADEGWIVRRVGVGSFVREQMPPQGDAGEPPAEGAPAPPSAGVVRQPCPYIGVVLQDWAPSYGLHLLSGIEKALAQRDLAMVLRRSYGNQQEEERAIEFLLGMGIQGLIIYPVDGEYYSPLILRLHLSGFPLVLVDRYLPGIQTNAVYSDNVAGACGAVRHLLELGHRRIALLSPSAQGTVSVQDRINGYTQALLEAGLPVDQSLCLTNLPSYRPTMSNEDGAADAAIRGLLADAPDITAVFAVEYLLAVRAQEIAASLGIGVPGELSLVCFDGPTALPHGGMFTHVRQAEYEMGRRAVELLMDALAGGESGRRVVLPTELVPGQTTAAATPRAAPRASVPSG